MRRRISSFYNQVANEHGISEDRVEELMKWVLDDITKNIKTSIATKISGLAIIRRNPNELLRSLHKMNKILVNDSKKINIVNLKKSKDQIEQLFLKLLEHKKYQSYRNAFTKLIISINERIIDYDARTIEDGKTGG